MRSYSPRFALILILSSIVLAAPVLAADAAPEVAVSEPAAPTLQEPGTPTLCPAPALAAPEAEPLAAAALCTAVADCDDGSTRSCSDTTSPADCHAVDEDCDAGIDGYVQCNGEPRQHCDTCTEEEDCTLVKECNPCGNAQPKCGCYCVRGACGRIDAWVCLVP